MGEGECQWRARTGVVAARRISGRMSLVTGGRHCFSHSCSALCDGQKQAEVDETSGRT